MATWASRPAQQFPPTNGTWSCRTRVVALAPLRVIPLSESGRAPARLRQRERQEAPPLLGGPNDRFLFRGKYPVNSRGKSGQLSRRVLLRSAASPCRLGPWSLQRPWSATLIRERRHRWPQWVDYLFRTPVRLDHADPPKVHSSPWLRISQTWTHFSGSEGGKGEGADGKRMGTEKRERVGSGRGREDQSTTSWTRMEEEGQGGHKLLSPSPMDHITTKPCSCTSSMPCAAGVRAHRAPSPGQVPLAH